MYEEDYSTKVLTQRARTNYITVTVQQTVFVENNFGSGNVSVNGSTVGSGASYNLSSGGSLSLSAIENQIDAQGYTRIWNNSGTNNSYWSVSGSNVSTSSSYSYNATSNQNGYHIIAYLMKRCSITFNGPVVANGTYYNGQPVPVTEGNPISITAQGYTSSDFNDMGFTSWGDANTQNPRTFTVYSNTSYGINYTGLKPNNGYKNMQYTGSVGQNIHIIWNEHPNANVIKYQVWRKVKDVSGPTLLTEADRGTTSFTDYEYVYTNGYTDNLLDYDIRAYYSSANSYADVDYVTTFGKVEFSKKEENKIAATTEEMPAEYSIANYPNPFNPATTIHYQLPQNDFVTIKVYDMLGKEIVTLVNGNKNAGYHSVSFNASKLTSGIYIYTINAGRFIQSKKMLLMK